MVFCTTRGGARDAHSWSPHPGNQTPPVASRARRLEACSRVPSWQSIARAQVPAEATRRARGSSLATKPKRNKTRVSALWSSSVGTVTPECFPNPPRSQHLQDGCKLPPCIAVQCRWMTLLDDVLLEGDQRGYRWPWRLPQLPFFGMQLLRASARHCILSNGPKKRKADNAPVRARGLQGSSTRLSSYRVKPNALLGILLPPHAVHQRQKLCHALSRLPHALASEMVTRASECRFWIGLLLRELYGRNSNGVENFDDGLGPQFLEICPCSCSGA